jgi:hypothetical protein
MTTPETLPEAEGPDEMIRNGRHFLVAIGLLGLAYLGGVAVNAVLNVVIEAASQSPEEENFLWPAVAAQTVGRFVMFALLTWFSWMVFRGPRRRAAGVGMVLVGLYFSLVTFLNLVVLADMGILLPPVPNDSGWSDLLIWTSVGVVVLGVIEIIWPGASDG